MFRKTNTIASVCCYVASTPSGNGDAMGMLDKMRGLSKLGTRERNKLYHEERRFIFYGYCRRGRTED